MLRNKGIAFKLIFLILLCCSIIFMTIFYYYSEFTSCTIKGLIKDRLEALNSAAVKSIEIELYAVEKIPESLAFSMEHITYREEDLVMVLRDIVMNSDEIYGACIAFEPNIFRNGETHHSIYVYEKPVEGIPPPLRIVSPRITQVYESERTLIILRGHETTGLGDYFYDDWYQIPKALGKSTWSEPYYDYKGGKVHMTTYSVPFYRAAGGERRRAGVITADVSLVKLDSIVRSIDTGGAGYPFLIYRNGTFIAHPLHELVMHETIFSLAEERKDPALRDLGKSMVRGDGNFQWGQSILDNERSLILYDPVASSGWSLGLVLPLKEILRDAHALKIKVEIMGVISFILLFVVIISISRSITRPLTILAKTTTEIARGNLDFQLPAFGTHDEVGRLAEMFLSMRDSLKKHIEELTRETAARQKMESELRIAHEIQMNMVPGTFPPFPDREELDLYSFLKPAKEVGGDFYDFFFINESHLLLVLGDISGKGVPAALLMARLMTLIKTEARGSQECETIMSLINREFSRNNEDCMFATTFLAILNTSTGALFYCNGGHNSPVLISSTGQVEFSKKAVSPPVGIDEDSVFKKDTMVMKPGDVLFLYTDGVTEAFNEEGELFGNERLMDTIRHHRDEPITDLAGNVVKAVVEFAGRQDQSDDITLQVLRYNGAK